MVHLIAVGAVLVAVLAVGLLWRHSRKNRTRYQRIQYIDLKYLDSDDKQVWVEAWVENVYCSRGRYAFEWYNTDDVEGITPRDNRTEIPLKRVVELNRGEWERIEAGGEVPY